MPVDRPDDREAPAVGQPAGRPDGPRRGGPLRRLGRRRIVTVVVLLGLLTAAGLGLRQVRQDPIRYGLDFAPFIDDADHGEAHLVDQLRDSVERTAGPYIGPNPDLSDAVGALNVRGIGPTGNSVRCLELRCAVLATRVGAAAAHDLPQPVTPPAPLR
jgi:hypothetical protein